MLRRLVTSNRSAPHRPANPYYRAFQRFLGRTLSATERVVISALERQRHRGRPRPVMVIDHDKNDSTNGPQRLPPLSPRDLPRRRHGTQHYPALRKNPSKNTTSKAHHLPSGRLSPRLNSLLHPHDRRSGRLLILPVPETPRRFPAPLPRPLPYTLRRGVYCHTHARRLAPFPRPRNRRVRLHPASETRSALSRHRRHTYIHRRRPPH